MFSPQEARTFQRPEIEARHNVGLGVYPEATDSVPGRFLTNKDLANWNIQTNSGRILDEEGILNITGGIERRYEAGKNESVITMGVAAAKRALSKWSGDNIDAIVVSTSLPDGDTAGAIQESLGLNNVNERRRIHAACAGVPRSFHYVLDNKERLKNKTILFIATENYGPILDPIDILLFSAGASAFVGTLGQDFDILGAKSQALSPKDNDAIRMPVDFSKVFDKKNDVFVEIPYAPKFYMEGRRVYKIVARNIPQDTVEFARQLGMPLEQFQHIVFHQGSGRIMEGLSQAQLLQPHQQRIVQDFTGGNWSSASSLKTFAHADQQGLIVPNKPMLFVGFGAGLHESFAALVVK